MDIKQVIGELIAKGETQQALETLRDMRGRIEPSTMMELDLLSSRYFTLQSKVRTNTIKFEDGNQELARINSSILEILDGKVIDSTSYNQLSKKYEQLILEIAESYKSISKEAHTAVRIRKKYKIVKFIAEKLNEYSELIEKFKTTDDQAIIGGIAYKIKANPKVEDLSILKSISERCRSNYSKGQIINAVGEIVYTGELRFGDDIEIKEILVKLESENDIPLTKNIERVLSALDHLLALRR